MIQCAIQRLRDGPELICRVQSELGVATSNILCAPVVPRSGWGSLVPKLHIPCEVNGVSHVIVMTSLVALPVHQLGAVVGDASARRDDVVAAVDLLVSGF